MKNIIRQSVKKVYLKLYDFINYFYLLNFKSKYKKEVLDQNQLVEKLPGERVLILAPHVDDDIIGCGGAIIKYLKSGKQVFIVYLTDSGKRGSSNDSNRVSEERKQEAVKTSMELGILERNLFFLQGEDGNLINSLIEDVFLKAYREINPDTIFMPCFLDSHNDHFAVTEKLLKLYEEGRIKTTNLFIYESQSPMTPLYSNTCLDITDEYNQKKSLCRFYISQSSDFKFSYTISKINGICFGDGKLCEAYIKTNLDKYFGLYKKECSGFNKFLEIKPKLIPHGESRDFIKSINSSILYKGSLKSL